MLLQSKQASVTLLNDYIVLGSLGKGAYGSVKLCYSMLDDSLYALKVRLGACLSESNVCLKARVGVLEIACCCCRAVLRACLEACVGVLEISGCFWAELTVDWRPVWRLNAVARLPCCPPAHAQVLQRAQLKRQLGPRPKPGEGHGGALDMLRCGRAGWRRPGLEAADWAKLQRCAACQACLRPRHAPTMQLHSPQLPIPCRFAQA